MTKIPLVGDILHVSFLVEDLDRSLHFYCDVLEIDADDSRPDLGYPGAWLNVGVQQIHLLRLPNPDRQENRPEHGGRDRHAAFNVPSIDAIKNKLDQAGILYTLSKSGRKAMFVRDPDANALEFIELV